jgi:enoyl-CoA hydratase/carnithine racemase
MQAATDIALTCRRVSAEEALQRGLIAAISKSADSVLAETVEKAKQIANVSPDGTIVTRAGLREAWETGSVERAFQVTHEQLYDSLIAAENCGEGLAAFREKRKPVWVDSKL